MSRYFDTGVLLKLYTEENGSDRVRDFVVRLGESIVFTPLHRAECVSALRLKVFRGECLQSQASAAIAFLDQDCASGVLRGTAVDWEEAWVRTAILSSKHASSIGCRTLDGLHVACALQLGAAEFVTGDKRQASLAGKVGLKVANPFR